MGWTRRAPGGADQESPRQGIFTPPRPRLQVMGRKTWVFGDAGSRPTRCERNFSRDLRGPVTGLALFRVARRMRTWSTPSPARGRAVSARPHRRPGRRVSLSKRGSWSHVSTRRSLSSNGSEGAICSDTQLLDGAPTAPCSCFGRPRHDLERNRLVLRRGGARRSGRARSRRLRNDFNR